MELALAQAQKNLGKTMSFRYYNYQRSSDRDYTKSVGPGSYNPNFYTKRTLETTKIGKSKRINTE